MKVYEIEKAASAIRKKMFETPYKKRTETLKKKVIKTECKKENVNPVFMEKLLGTMDYRKIEKI